MVVSKSNDQGMHSFTVPRLLSYVMYFENLKTNIHVVSTDHKYSYIEKKKSERQKVYIEVNIYM